MVHQWYKLDTSDKRLLICNDSYILHPLQYIHYHHNFIISNTCLSMISSQLKHSIMNFFILIEHPVSLLP